MRGQIRIGIFGDYNPDAPTHTATDAAIEHAAQTLGLRAEVEWVGTDILATEGAQILAGFDALWCAPGSPFRSFEGALEGIRFARDGGYPFLGTCAGFQHAVIEYARNVLGFAGAQHAENDPDASALFVSALYCSLVGQSMRVYLTPGSKAHSFYAHDEAVEEYYCTFGLNPAYRSVIHEGGLRVVGVDRDGEARILELPERDFYVATLFVPQLTSTADEPHPLIVAYLRAAFRAKEITAQTLPRIRRIQSG